MAKRKYPIWRVYPEAFLNSYYAEKIAPDGKMLEYRDSISAHCLTCAKTELMVETGEIADIRGWHKVTKNMCGGMAKATQVGNLEDINAELVIGYDEDARAELQNIEDLQEWNK